MESWSHFLMGFPVPLPEGCRDRGKRKRDRVPACRHPPPCAKERWSGRRDVPSIEHRDGRNGEHQFPCSFPGLFTLFEGTLSMVIDVAYRNVWRSRIIP
jgi:hypothetical protein